MASPLPTLIIVRHARPAIQPDAPAAAWPLAPEDRAGATALGAHLRVLGSLRIIASGEVKAIQTGEAILPETTVATDDRFGEQGLGTVPILPAEVFRERVLAHFQHPDARFLGDESSRDAAFRFDAGIQAVTTAKPGIPVIVSHGRIIAAWLTMFARPAHGEPITAADCWESLRMPDALLVQRDANDHNRWIWRRFDDEGEC